jgi:uracil-DNA glycosylase
MPGVSSLLSAVRACTVCAEYLPLGPRPVVQLHPAAKILIVGQAPGRKVHETGVPFNDASGDRLRAWLGVTREVFYDVRQIALLPMGFCYPGTGAGGDLPPRAECAATWRKPLLATLRRLQLTLVLGSYALDYHFGSGTASVTERVRSWRSTWPRLVPLPHPSPRNNRWLRQNPWLERELLPAVRARVAQVLHAEPTR